MKAKGPGSLASRAFCYEDESIADKLLIILDS